MYILAALLCILLGCFQRWIIAPTINGFLSPFAGDIIHFDPHQLVRVLPARGRDHPADLPRRPPPREVPHIRHDTGLNKVSELKWEEAEMIHLLKCI